MIVFQSACESTENKEERAKELEVKNYLADGKETLARGDVETAIDLLKRADRQRPNNVETILLLADAYTQNQNETSAVLMLKQAEELTGDDPSIKRARADLYLSLHQNAAAIAEFLKLKELELLTDKENRFLAILQAREGRTDDAFVTLNAILQRDPDDPETKVTEAEILLTKGDDVLAAKLMDKLVADNPTQTSALLLRSKYFFANGQSELALKDLEQVPKADLESPEVIAQRVAVLNATERSDEAFALLNKVIERDAKNELALTLLAETQLKKMQLVEAQVTADKALAVNARSARALYVRGLASEIQKRPEAALLDYEAARQIDPSLASVLSHIWPLYLSAGRKADTIGILEKLMHLSSQNTEEKAQLAKLYAESFIQIELARTLISEALKHSPNNAEYKAIAKQLAGKQKKKQIGPLIIKGKHHR
jgi:tetratricopeptide (TPR) repeat protein